MTLVYRDPTLLASTLTPLVDLADKVVRLQHKLDPESALHAALRAAEGRIAESIVEYLETKPEEPESAEGAAQTFKVGDRVRIARRVDIGGWCLEMDHTVGQCGKIRAIDSVVTDDIPVYVETDSGARWYYPPSALDLVTDRTPTTDPK